MSEEKKILHLTLKKKWFAMIASGEKREEYREVKPYWISRLVDGLDAPHSCEDFNFIWRDYKHSMRSAQHYDLVQFKHGYSKDAPQMQVEIKDIIIDITGKEQWGAEYCKQYFIIKLGKILSIKNYNQ